jgi:DNA adenine methylase
MCVSLNYKGRVIRTANEINSDITNFFEVLRTREAELVRLLLLTPCSIQEYNAYIRFISPVKLTRFSGGI